MQSIGEQLEEARKRKGISLREAAEATKIRSDFLSYIEQNRMDFDLPEIYKRGFLKNYARYLRLDIDKIMTDYNAVQLSNSRLNKKGGAEWFGQMDIKKSEGETEEPESSSDGDTGYGRISSKSPQPIDADVIDDEEEEADNTFYMKIGLIFVGTIALLFVVFGLVWAILGSGGTADSGGTDTADSAEIVEPLETETSLGANEPESITLTASGNVYVLVKQQLDEQKLFDQIMTEGQTVTLLKQGPVDIAFNAGENLSVKVKGGSVIPSRAGTAIIKIP